MNRGMIFKATRMASVAALMLVALFLSAAQQTPRATDNTVKLTDLIRDTQKDTPNPNEMTLVWWVPNEYWEVSFRDAPDMTPEFAKKFVAAVDSYTIIAAIDGRIGTLGSIKYKSEAEIRSSISVVDGGGQTYYPIAASAIDGDAKNLVDAMKPILANAMGPMGQNMNFYLFSGKDKQGGRLFDPRKEGGFTVKMGEREFKWRLPLGSLLPAKTCPKCGETLSGAYKFCPWDGSALADGKDPQGLENPISDGRLSRVRDTGDPGMPDDNSQAVRIAIIDSQKAFDLSKEGQRIISLGDRISKKTLDEEIQRIRTEMVVIVNEIAKERGYSLVVDLKTSGIIGYYPPTEDITDELVRRYNLSK